MKHVYFEAFILPSPHQTIKYTDTLARSFAYYTRSARHRLWNSIHTMNLPTAARSPLECENVLGS
jgi:hypothetical protein